MQKGSIPGLVQVEWSHPVRVLTGIISGTVPTPSFYKNESEA